ncbi:hypothetical protein [Streptomyces sp. NPDC058683]|uniref:hypothetical protein n=1 Tax=Streptomyces sp. NPDC058683 TaxID=3346597 RepID=UPI0036483F80
MTNPVACRDDCTIGNPEWTGIRTLGHANRFAVWDSEFRYDGRIRVPAGVKIKQIKYSYYYRYTAPHSSALSVFPGGPPEVTPTRAGGTGYPGVRLVADGDGTVPAQSVRVSLRKARGCSSSPRATPATCWRSKAWVAVRASHNAPWERPT